MMKHFYLKYTILMFMMTVMYSVMVYSEENAPQAHHPVIVELRNLVNALQEFAGIISKAQERIWIGSSFKDWASGDVPLGENIVNRNSEIVQGVFGASTNFSRLLQENTLGVGQWTEEDEAFSLTLGKLRSKVEEFRTLRERLISARDRIKALDDQDHRRDNAVAGAYERSQHSFFRRNFWEAVSIFSFGYVDGDPDVSRAQGSDKDYMAFQGGRDATRKAYDDAAMAWTTCRQEILGLAQSLAAEGEGAYLKSLTSRFGGTLCEVKGGLEAACEKMRSVIQNPAMEQELHKIVSSEIARFIESSVSPNQEDGKVFFRFGEEGDPEKESLLKAFDEDLKNVIDEELRRHQQFSNIEVDSTSPEFLKLSKFIRDMDAWECKFEIKLLALELRKAWIKSSKTIEIGCILR